MSMKRFAIGLITVAIALTFGIGSASATPPTAPSIQPHQYFVGLINGRAATSVISVTGCSTAAAGDGHPLGGQSAEVSQVVAIVTTYGFTGGAHRVNVDLDIPALDPMLPLIRVVHLGELSSYNTPLFISPFMTLPCQGMATAVFSPIAGGPNARSTSVGVTFVNPRIVPSPSQLIPAGTQIHLAGSGFAPNTRYHVAECSQTSWVVTQNPCVGPGVDVVTSSAGAFSHGFVVEPCATPTASLVGTCYIGVPQVSGVDTVELVAAARITVILRPSRT
jgi:hypothetical protein